MRNQVPDGTRSFNDIAGMPNGWNLMSLACIGLFMVLGLPAFAGAVPSDADNRFVLDREGRSIVVEPYGPNIVRITLSINRPAALAIPGYGINGTPSSNGWTRAQESGG